MVGVTDTDLNRKVRKTCERISENLYVIGNEPTLACFRVAEHLYKNGPATQDRKFEMRSLETQLRDCCFGLEYSLKALKSIEKSQSTFSRIKNLLRDTHFNKQQINYDRAVHQRVARMSQGNSS
ncbi:BLOC-1-related complex subunit 8 homolog [Brevipalpus obovatus]|uniref:BLOC-1-related complex subunit 8 homolog n=1 Tax=Brevipalpus obovatus TaxID=246614 RepID=UPI003D9EE6B1